MAQAPILSMGFSLDIEDPLGVFGVSHVNDFYCYDYTL